MAISILNAAPQTQLAEPSDLRYALVTPGAWTFIGLPIGVSLAQAVYAESIGEWIFTFTDGIDEFDVNASGSETETRLSFYFSGNPVTATRTLPGHLFDRANNLVDATSANVTLTLPPFVAGKVRDLLVACTIGIDTNDEPWSVIFQGQGSEAPSGADEISFKAEGDDASTATFPVPTAAGDWWYSLTERAPHVFAVSLKQLQSVSQPTQTQGGS